MSKKTQTSLLIDIGNTHTHIGWHEANRWFGFYEFPTVKLLDHDFNNLHPPTELEFSPDWSGFCSVVPDASEALRQYLKSQGLKNGFTELTWNNPIGLGIDYPKPETIGPDRIANAMAAAHFYGAPSVVVDFGTAVTFDVVDRNRKYVGGIIAPGVSVMTDYLHEKTALLPRIEIKDPGAIIGKNTEQAMQIGAVHGYRGLVRTLIEELKSTLAEDHLPVIATGGYAELIAGNISTISDIRPNLTLEGLMLMAQ